MSVTQKSIDDAIEKLNKTRQAIQDAKAGRAANESQVALEIHARQIELEQKRLDAELADAQANSKVTELRKAAPDIDAVKAQMADALAVEGSADAPKEKS